MKLEKKAKKNHTRNYVAGLFDVDERHARLTLLGDPLVELKKMTDWEAFRSEIEAAREISAGPQMQECSRSQTDRRRTDVQDGGVAATEQLVG